MTATKSEPLPPDVDAARKARINSELIEVFRRPCPADATPSIQGIGLYTHVAGPPAPALVFPHMKYMQKASNPVFLQIGGPAGISKEGNVLEAPISDDVKRAWKDVQEAVDREKAHLAHTDLDVDSLKERYGALDKNAGAQPKLQPHLQHIMDRMQDATMTGIQNTAAGAGQQPNGRRASGEDGLSRDVTMGGTDEARRGSTSTTWTGNDYEAARDPRLRGR